jgi:hypothetical protein
MMNHNRPYNGGGHRRRHRGEVGNTRKLSWSPTLVAEDYERREIIQETPEERLTSTIVKLGEVVS